MHGYGQNRNEQPVLLPETQASTIRNNPWSLVWEHLGAGLACSDRILPSPEWSNLHTVGIHNDVNEWVARTNVASQLRLALWSLLPPILTHVWRAEETGESNRLGGFLELYYPDGLWQMITTWSMMQFQPLSKKMKVTRYLRLVASTGKAVTSGMGKSLFLTIQLFCFWLGHRKVHRYSQLLEMLMLWLSTPAACHIILTAWSWKILSLSQLLLSISVRSAAWLFWYLCLFLFSFISTED